MLLLVDPGALVVAAIGSAVGAGRVGVKFCACTFAAVVVVGVDCLARAVLVFVVFGLYFLVSLSVISVRAGGVICAVGAGLYCLASLLVSIGVLVVFSILVQSLSMILVVVGGVGGVDCLVVFVLCFLVLVLPAVAIAGVIVILEGTGRQFAATVFDGGASVGIFFCCWWWCWFGFSVFSCCTAFVGCCQCYSLCGGGGVIVVVIVFVVFNIL